MNETNGYCFCFVCACVFYCVRVGGSGMGCDEVIGEAGRWRIVAELGDVWVLVCRSIFL